jgi:dTDP-4-dehydrorhamnose reductase
MEKVRPDVIVNCAAYTNVDGCETNEETALLVNGRGPGHLAGAAKELGATLVHVSTDYVFDGTKNSPYTEEDVTNPQSAYGRSKLRGERAILESGLDKFFIVRTSWLYGSGGKNFVETIARLATEREELRIVADQVGSPTLTDDLARAIFNLLALDASPAFAKASAGRRLTPHEPYGIYHFADEGECSWYEFAEAIVAHLLEAETPLKMKRILPIATHEYPLPATRPAYSVFSKDKYRKVTGAKIPNWKTSLVTYLRSFRTQIKADARR